MNDLLAGRVAAITGAGRGQGAAAALVFARHGARIVVNDLDDSAVHKTVSAIRSAGGDAVGASGDVSNPGDVEAILRTGMDCYGRIDVLYNNAGIGYSAERQGIAMADIVNCREADWARVIEVNLSSVYLVCKYGIPLMIARGGGSIINTSSVGALRGGREAHAYGASKAGIVALTRSIAVAYGAQGIRANTICPGVIDTDMVKDRLAARANTRTAVERTTPLGRIGRPEDVANVALFLASDLSAYVTGQTLAVDGGISIC